MLRHDIPTQFAAFVKNERHKNKNGGKGRRSSLT